MIYNLGGKVEFVVNCEYGKVELEIFGDVILF